LVCWKLRTSRGRGRSRRALARLLPIQKYSECAKKGTQLGLTNAHFSARSHREECFDTFRNTPN